MKLPRPTLLCSAVLAALLTLPGLALAASPAWVERSNALAAPVMNDQARFYPEAASQAGREEFDTATADFGPRLYERKQEANRQRLDWLKTQRTKETDPKVLQDLDIMIERISSDISEGELRHALLLPYRDVPATIYFGLDTLLDAQNTPARKARALTRLKRYVGNAPGYEPLTLQARARTEEMLAREGLTGPYVEELKQKLDNVDFYLKGIEKLLKQSQLKGWQADFAKLTRQLHDYRDWARTTILPKARKEAREPAALYAESLRGAGVDLTPDQLIDRATAEFQEVRDQMQMLATRIAAERKWPSSDYRDVSRALKKEQIEPNAMLQRYWQRLKDIEAIIRRENLLTLPNRDAKIRLATEAEAAAVPSPQMKAPRLIGNTGEYGEFLIPTVNPHAKSTEKMDDFSYDAATWTLAAHEARPGHELQFAAMVERGVSLPRAWFAYNSANVEGWALYSEAIVLPHMPPEAQLISLQDRLLRIARAFLDPMVNLGRLSPAEAKRLLMEDVIQSEPFAQQEIDRYTFNAPGQATGYFYGYLSLRALRTQTELALGKHFNQAAFHDFVVAQGMLPPQLLKQAVLKEFVPAQLAAAKAKGETVALQN
ncbi:DUF885 domain-containing protein [Parachitinimonas caeni]|uniref:DUF885 domain-containing protein n=1 Tax=Parachitinimonas caeni TaxID=3031301 RepID=A0ABT7DZU7_9NEIS|nr:DUF885 domain-containing protein [Parachitinimonas caeni]MDK2125582.1 DUF885 domain-containing protein [Parachitinimonas caeni]